MCGTLLIKSHDLKLAEQQQHWVWCIAGCQPAAGYAHVDLHIKCVTRAALAVLCCVLLCAGLFGVCPPGHGRNFERFAESYEAVDVFNKRSKVRLECAALQLFAIATRCPLRHQGTRHYTT